MRSKSTRTPIHPSLIHLIFKSKPARTPLPRIIMDRRQVSQPPPSIGCVSLTDATEEPISHVYFGSTKQPLKECWICLLNPKGKPEELFKKKVWKELPLCADHSITRLLLQHPDMNCYLCWHTGNDDLFPEYSFCEIGAERLPLCLLHDIGLPRGRERLTSA